MSTADNGEQSGMPERTPLGTRLFRSESFALDDHALGRADRCDGFSVGSFKARFDSEFNPVAFVVAPPHRPKRRFEATVLPRRNDILELKFTANVTRLSEGNKRVLI